MNLILASTSPYRHGLLQRLQTPFRSMAPDTIETAIEGEPAQALVGRLAMAKAKCISANYPDALVIGGDQVATLEGAIIGKPIHHKTAVAQLQACSGKKVTFYTGVAVICEDTGFAQTHVEPFAVYFRSLSNLEIENYLSAEQPYDCAGSFKCEGLGIALFTRLSGADPTSLEGLPLIAVVDMLTAAGHKLLAGIN